MESTINLIGIDPSLISTAVTINGNIIYNYCRKEDAYNKTSLKKWFLYAQPYITYKFITFDKFDDYSDGEIKKLNNYFEITTLIVDDILAAIDVSKETHIYIEGYSYSSDPTSIIDLVTFSTLLRKKLYDNVTKNITILSPSTLKKESAMLTYPAINVGKKVEKLEWRNYSGVKGGSFKKEDMYKAITDNVSFTDRYSEHLRVILSEVFQFTKIPKPYEDVNDSFLLYQVLKRKLSTK